MPPRDAGVSGLPVAPPLAYIYDRCVTSNLAMLDMRLRACGEHMAEQGWDDGGRFIDYGDNALTLDTRPAFDQLVRILGAAPGRERVCLVYDWGRLSHDVSQRQVFAHLVLGSGASLVTLGGETLRAGMVPDGRLTSAPQVTV